MECEKCGKAVTAADITDATHRDCGGKIIVKKLKGNKYDRA